MRWVTGLILGVIVGLLAVAIILPSGMYAYYQAYDTIDDLNLGTQGNQTRTNINTNVWGAFSLLAVTPTLIGAAAIIMILVAAFAAIKLR